MKKITLLILTFISYQLSAQEFSKMDASPLDMAYYPRNSAHDLTFAKTVDEKAGLMTQIKIMYSRPQAKGRTVFGGIVEYGKEWRIGANETTEVTFYSPVRIGDAILFPGTYAMYIIPEKDNWTLKFHPTVNGWGVYNFDFSKELASVQSKVSNTPENVEALSITMYESDSGAVHIKIGWADSMAEFPITLLKSISK
jgi:hypothetical protein